MNEALISEAKDKLRAYFVDDPRLSFTTAKDTEDDSRMYLEANTSLGVIEARQCLSNFDREWWLENMRRARGSLSVAMRFI